MYDNMQNIHQFHVTFGTVQYNEKDIYGDILKIVSTLFVCVCVSQIDTIRMHDKYYLKNISEFTVLW